MASNTLDSHKDIIISWLQDDNMKISGVTKRLQTDFGIIISHRTMQRRCKVYVGLTQGLRSGCDRQPESDQNSVDNCKTMLKTKERSGRYWA